MDRKYFHTHHVENSALLPAVLTPGTAYFVDDEQSIIVDYGDGRGPVTYGGTFSAAGTAGGTGDAGFVQDQINTLAGGVLAFEKIYWDETQYTRRRFSHIAEVSEAETVHLQEQNNANAEGILRLAEVINEQAETQADALSGLRKNVYSNTEGILRLVSVINEQAETQADALSGVRKIVHSNSEGILRLAGIVHEQAETQADALSGVRQIAHSNAEGILRLSGIINEQAESTGDQIARLTRQTNANTEAVLHLARAVNDLANRTKASIAFLNRTVTYLLSTLDIPLPEVPQDKDPLDNETVETDNGTWVIQQTFNPDGTISFELQAVALTAETLTAGDTISCDSGDWTVESIERDDGTISLSLRQ